MNIKRTLTGIFAGLLIAMMAFSTTFAANNLLENGDFTEGNGQNSVKGWNVQTFAGSGTVKHVTANDADAPYVTLTTNEDSDFRLIQTVQAQPNTTYKFSGKIKAEGVKNKNNTGAILSVTYSQDFTDSLYDTNGKWKEVEMYIRTNDAKTFFDVSIGVGGHSSLNNGTASFKDLKLEVYKKKVPADATVCDMSVFTQSAAQSGNGTSNANSTSNSKWLMIVLIVVVGCVIIYLLLFSGKKPEEKDENAADAESADAESADDESADDADAVDDADDADAEDAEDAEDAVDAVDAEDAEDAVDAVADAADEAEV